VYSESREPPAAGVVAAGVVDTGVVATGVVPVVVELAGMPAEPPANACPAAVCAAVGAVEDE
jgi:hypothetical protein